MVNIQTLIYLTVVYNNFTIMKLLYSGSKQTSLPQPPWSLIKSLFSKLSGDTKIFCWAQTLVMKFGLTLALLMFFNKMKVFTQRMVIVQKVMF